MRCFARGFNNSYTIAFIPQLLNRGADLLPGKRPGSFEVELTSNCFFFTNVSKGANQFSIKNTWEYEYLIYSHRDFVKNENPVA
jgi:hypothetical protein